MKRVYYYSNVIRRVTSSLMTYFKDIRVIRKEKDGSNYQDILVPLVFGPLGKQYAYRKELESKKIYYQNRPKITFSMTGITYDAERTKSTQEMRLIYDPWFQQNKLTPDEKQRFYADITPAAYTFNYKVEILCEYMDDFCQIAEQVLPWFNPSVYLRIREWEFSNIERNIQVNLSSMSTEFTEEYQTDDEIKVITGTLDLEAKAWIYKPIRDARLLEIINTQFIADHDPVEQFGLFGSFDPSRRPPKDTILEEKEDTRMGEDAKIFLTNRNLINPPDIDQPGPPRPPPPAEPEFPEGCGDPNCPGCNSTEMCVCGKAHRPKKIRRRKPHK